MEDNKVYNNRDGLDKLLKNLKADLAVKIGILYDSKQREDSDGTSNIEIAVESEFGSFSKNIPARSWLRMPLDSHQDEIKDKFAKSKDVKKALDKGDKKQALKLLGVLAEDVIQQAFETKGFGKWQPNSPVTIAAKGSDFPLVDTSQFRRAVLSKVEKNNG